MIAGEARCAWTELEARLRPYVARRVASPSDVDDIVQEVFVRAHRGLGELRDGESFGGWVYRIAERAVVDHRRRRSRHPLASAPPPELGDLTEGAADGDDDLVGELTECSWVVVILVATSPLSAGSLRTCRTRAPGCRAARC